MLFRTFTPVVKLTFMTDLGIKSFHSALVPSPSIYSLGWCHCLSSSDIILSLLIKSTNPIFTTRHERLSSEGLVLQSLNYRIEERSYKKKCKLIHSRLVFLFKLFAVTDKWMELWALKIKIPAMTTTVVGGCSVKIWVYCFCDWFEFMAGSHAVAFEAIIVALVVRTRLSRKENRVWSWTTRLWTNYYSNLFSDAHQNFNRLLMAFTKETQRAYDANYVKSSAVGRTFGR